MADLPNYEDVPPTDFAAADEIPGPTLGLVIVNYNYAAYVAEAITSALAQKPPYDRIVVVDDGSTDNSLEVIHDFAEAVDILSKTNGGQLSASLAGIEHLQTDYCHVLDADDMLAPSAAATIRTHLTERLAKLQFQLRPFSMKTGLLGSSFPSYSAGYGSQQMMIDNCVLGFYHCPPTSGNVFSREVIQKLNTSKIDLRDFIDGPPAMAMPYLGRVVSVNEVIAHYRIHDSNHSRWDQPTPALLQKEISWFYRRWEDACRLLELPRAPFDNEPVYVLERALMIHSLESGANILLVRRFIAGLLGSKLPVRQRLLLMTWSILLLFAPKRMRAKLVFARRSPVNRSGWAQRLVAKITRGRESKEKAEKAEMHTNYVASR